MAVKTIKDKKSTINVLGTSITVVSTKTDDYICLTDMAKKFGDEVLIYSWMRNRNTLEFLGIWEQIHNPSFKGHEFETFKTVVGLNNFNLTPKKSERLKKLNEVAIVQLRSLANNSSVKLLCDEKNV